MKYQNLRNKENPTYKLPEIKTKSKWSELRMAPASQQHSKKAEEDETTLSKFSEEIISG